MKDVVTCTSPNCPICKMLARDALQCDPPLVCADSEPLSAQELSAVNQYEQHTADMTPGAITWIPGPPRPPRCVTHPLAALVFLLVGVLVGLSVHV